MGIKLDPTEPKRDWFRALFQLGTASVAAFLENPIRVISSTHKGLIALRKADANLEQRAWVLWQDSITLSLLELLSSVPQNYISGCDDFDPFITQQLKNSKQLAQSITLQADHHGSPLSFELYQSFRTKLVSEITVFFPDWDVNAGNLEKEINTIFQKRWGDVLLKENDYFKSIEAAFQSTAGQMDQRQYEWLKYNNGLRADVENAPLFGQEKETGITLSDIFVPLRSYWYKSPKQAFNQPMGQEQQSDEKTQIHVQMLGDFLQEWVFKADKNDNIRIVTGGPGSGKSSSAKIFAAEMASKEDINVFLTPLQGLDVSKEIPEIIESYITKMQYGRQCLPGSPLNWLRDDDKLHILIFDGLDEVQRPDAGGDDATRKFIYKLHSWLREINGSRTNQAPVLAIVLGRPTAVAESAKEMDLKTEAILNVLPLARLTHNIFERHGNQNGIEVNDPKLLCDQEQRKQFWKKNAIARKESQDTPDGLLEENLRDLTTEPLLLYLLIYSGYLGKKWPEAAENRNRIYLSIFTQVHERDTRKLTNTKEGIKEEEYFCLMECLGLATWHEGGRTGSNNQFCELRDTIYAPHLSDQLKGLDAAELKNVALQFYTFPGQAEAEGYEFIHKSFSEYLVGKALVNFGDKTLELLALGDKDAAARKWLKLTGSQELSSEHIAWLDREVRLRSMSNFQAKPDWESARKKVKSIVTLINWVLENGLPAHEEGAGNWLSRNKQQLYAEATLFALLNAWAKVAYQKELFQKDEADGGWDVGPIKIIWNQSKQEHKNVIVSKNNGFVEWLFKHSVSTQDLSNVVLDRLDLTSSSFSNMTVSNLTLRWCNFENVQWHGANFNRTNLTGSSFAHSTLFFAHFERSNVKDCNFEKAKLINAIFRPFHTSPEISDNTILKIDQELSDKHSAKGLTQEQVNSMLGDEETTLPSHLKRPESWRKEIEEDGKESE